MQPDSETSNPSEKTPLEKATALLARALGRIAFLRVEAATWEQRYNEAIKLLTTTGKEK